MQIIKIIVFRFIAIVLGFIIAFSIGELGIRIISPQETGPIQFAFNNELGEIPVPNQHGRRTLPGVYDYTYSNNSYGFRGHKEYTFEKTSNFRVLFLGDSFTYGIGVNDDQTFAYHIENNLSDFLGSVEVINSGNGGKGTDYALKLFQTLGYKYKPDLAALCFFPNDFSDNERNEYFHLDSDGKLHAKSFVSSIGAKKAFFMNIPGYNWFISWSHVANLLKQAALKYMVSFSSNSDLVVHYRNKEDNYSNHKNIELTNILIIKLKESVKSTGSKLIIFFIPDSSAVSLYRRSHSLSKDENAIMNLASNLNINFLSLTPIISDTEYKLDKLYYKEGHWTPRAHYIAAKYMSSHIKQCLENQQLFVVN